jgi:hypothetical protein
MAKGKGTKGQTMIFKKSLKTLKWRSETTNRRRTDNTMVKEKAQKVKQWSTKHYLEIKEQQQPL